MKFFAKICYEYPIVGIRSLLNYMKFFAKISDEEYHIFGIRSLLNYKALLSRKQKIITNMLADG